MHDSDKVLEDAKRRTVPNIDEVLVAPTVVAEQLYQSVAEERAIEESRGVLGRALDKGTIGGGVWAKVCKKNWYTVLALTVSSEANQELSKRRISQKSTDQKDRKRYGYLSGWHVDLTRNESMVVSKNPGLSLVPSVSSGFAKLQVRLSGKVIHRFCKCRYCMNPTFQPDNHRKINSIIRGRSKVNSFELSTFENFLFTTSHTRLASIRL